VIRIRSRHSRRRLPIQRSAIAFADEKAELLGVVAEVHQEVPAW